MAQVHTEMFVAELVNQKKAHFHEMSKEAQRVLLKLRHLVEDYSRDMREWRRTSTDHRQWKLEAYRLPPVVAAYVVALGDSEAAGQRLLLSLKEVGVIEERLFNQLRGTHYLLEGVISRPADRVDSIFQLTIDTGEPQ